ncbi:stage II sporulation protein P [Alkalithermobacter thermoalcaliphilus JW-YL-7 = DSM 7308]|uniref:Stage II sporulation protein P n=1 Tax=Alkalithermobacter thermoalcaliphilus JW-YL-7 = DSM 7308 TaxID=1121328 RepID=A0A150FSE7_CLOPD|nr:stage II sporulation protein P [[Clostridium] paradoxum JW-YL-7 = DSM 7308]SHL01438.1 stage II sporulation protein P [[Clostridium] paradoxum JW-YL-7 = DSM 7308]
MKRKNITHILTLGILFAYLFSFTSFAIGQGQEDFLKYLLRKTYPEVTLEGENRGLLSIGFGLLNRRNDNNNVANDSQSSIKITVLEDDEKPTLIDNIQTVTSDENKQTNQSQNENTNASVPDKIDLQKGKPQILIYHTHGTESYEPERTGNYHSLNKKYNVMSVGGALKEHLEKRGYVVLHNMDYHDYPSFNGSYTRSLQTARKILQENPSIKVVLDVHRDGMVAKDDETRNRIRQQNTVKINGEDVAKFMLVVGPESPNRKEVENFARYITKVANEKYPGIARNVLVKPYGRFNQFLSNNYALLEVGTNFNTIDEVIRTTKYLAEILDEVIKSTNR